MQPEHIWSPVTVASTVGPASAPAATPSTPPWLLGRHTPELPGCPTCLICHGDVLPAATGPEAPFPWPQCGHALHLGCAAHMVVNVAPSALTCPSCRAAWPPAAADVLLASCRQHDLPLPAAAPDMTPLPMLTGPPRPLALHATSCPCAARACF